MLIERISGKAFSNLVGGLVVPGGSQLGKEMGRDSARDLKLGKRVVNKLRTPKGIEWSVFEEEQRCL